MKRISRFTALLLAMMLLMTDALALTLDSLTQDALESLYSIEADEQTVTLDQGVLGEWMTITTFGEVTDRTGYSFVWYDEEGNVQTATADDPAALDVRVTMQEQKYSCVMTEDGAELNRRHFIIPAAQTTDMEAYVGFLSSYAWDNDAVQYDKELIYDYLIHVWNVTVGETTLGANAAAEWWLNWSDFATHFDMMCTCVLSGAVEAEQCVLYPGTSQHAEGCEWAGEGEIIEPDIPQPPLYHGDPQGKQYISTAEYTLPMDGQRAVILPEGGRAFIRANAADGAQWQVSDGTRWVDIAGENKASLVATTAKLNAIFELTGVAELRYFDKDSQTVLASVSVTSQKIANGEYVDPAEAQMTLFAMARAESDKHTIVINYLFSDGEIVTSPYTATIEKGGNFAATVPNPAVRGYKLSADNAVNVPAGFTYQDAQVDISVENIQADMQLNVYYEPTLVNYTVIHYAQNTGDDNYTEAARETMTGLTKSQVDEVALDKRNLTQLPNNTRFNPTGFFSLVYEKANIAADGSTIVEVYYDRNYYLLNFDLGGGYGVEPVYARYGTPVDTKAVPEREGYTFKGWVDEKGQPAVLASEIPAHNLKYVAVWEGQATQYTVIYWQENANDDAYSYVESKKVNAVAGTLVSGSDDKNYTGFHFKRADTEVEVAGDGSAIVNVYYERNRHTLTFAYNGGPLICDVHVHSDACYQRTLTCTRTEHSHSDSCCKYGDWHRDHGNSCCKLGLTAHSHGSSCYRSTLICNISGVNNHSHSVANGCYGIKFENVKYGQATDSYWAQAPSYKWLVSSSGSTFYTNAPAMPDKDFIIYGTSQSGSSVIHYYEKVNGQETTIKVRDDYQVNTSGWRFTSEDYIEIPGFTYSSSRKNSAGTEYFIYYTREKYDLTFNNRGTETVEKDIAYQQNISGTYFVPTYTGDNADIHVFGGWYTTQNCVEGTEFVFDGATMPANNLVLYASWERISREVRFYQSLEAMNAGTELATHPMKKVAHGSKITESIADPVNGDYNFVGWFYLEIDEATNTAVEKAIDFENMPITHDLKVYAKWSSNKLKAYTVYFKYKDENGNEIEIADSITGSSLAGMTKTFDAKGDEDLKPEYRKGYFPEVKSHSITLNIDDADNTGANTYTFWYVKKAAVPYIVRYWVPGADGAYTLPEQLIHSDNNKAVVTETFKVIPGYMPDAYQKRLVISEEPLAEGESWIVVGNVSVHPDNVINFYYKEDVVNAYYKVSHWLEPLEGTNWTEYGTGTQAPAEIGSTLNANSYDLTLDGYTFDVNRTENVVDGTATVVGGDNVTLTDKGLELKLYYVRNKYPYEIRHEELNTGVTLAPTESGQAKYGATVAGSEAAIPGYTYSQTTPPEGQINIRIEKNAAAELNVITYYYVENDATIRYIGVDPNGKEFTLTDACGTLSDDEETVKVMSGTVLGATATANTPAYKFVGWYSDAACTETALLTADAKYTPAKTTSYTVNGVVRDAYESAVFYAKFEWNVADLSITKTVVDSDRDVTAPTGDTFTMTVTLPAGEYAYTGTLGSSGTLVVTQANPSADLTIKAGETITIKGVVIGSAYTVTETGHPACFKPSGPVTGTIAPDSAQNTALITNTYMTRNLTIKKQVVEQVGFASPSDAKFVFHVTLTEPHLGDSVSVSIGNEAAQPMKLENNVLTFTLMDQQSVTIYNLPAGTEYLVEEVVPENFSVEYDGYARGTMGENDVTTVVTNHYPLRYGELKVEKSGMKANESAIVEVVVTTNQTPVTYILVLNSDNLSATITHLMVGSAYTVTERTNWSWLYSDEPQYKNRTGNISDTLSTCTIYNHGYADKWMHDESYVVNDFGDGSQSGVNQ